MSNKTRIFTASMGAAMLALSAWAWTVIPAGARVPMHWNIHGEVDGWGSKTMAIGFVPAMTVFVLGAILLAMRLDPRQEHVEQSRKALDAIVAAIAAFMAVIHGALLMAATGHAIDVVSVSLAGVGGLIALLGNFMGKLRSNYFAGIRTPWTLSSEKSWGRTHRLFGRLFMATGLATMLAAGWGHYLAAFIVLMVGIFGSVAGSVVYSYLVWKNDPDKKE